MADEEIDETTLGRERRASEHRVETAVHDTIQSNALLAELRGLASRARDLHTENHYVPRLRRIFRGA